MAKIRKRLLDNVYLTHVSATKFKTDFLSAQFITPLRRETAGLNSLLPAVLQRGTERYPDMQRLSAAQDLLYGANIEHSVRKRGENQVWGFVATCIDDSFIPGEERLLEPLAELLGELLCKPVMENGLLRKDYVESERTNLIELIRAEINEKLMEQYQEAAAAFPGMLSQLQAHLTYSATFEEDFDAPFG